MGQIEKTVFISYRRTNLPWALAIYQNLTTHGYDVFFDYQNVNSGDFEQVILGNIRARAHFVVILTPSMLEEINEPGDWVRLEIETAMNEKRNIVPLFLEGFDFGSPSISGLLIGKLAGLKKYGGLDVPASYFLEAMERLRSRHLNVALDAVIHPVSEGIQEAIREQKIAADKEKPVEVKELTAQEWFERGKKSTDLDEKIHCYSESIGLKPDYASAYNNRGNVRSDKGDLDGAIKDYNEAIRLKPDYALAYNNRGSARSDKGDFDGAIQDYNEAIRLKPDYALAYFNRGNVRSNKGDLDGAIKDYNEAIHLKPDYALAYYNRANAWEKKAAYRAAMNDYQKYLNLGEGIRYGDQKEVEGFIRDLKKKIK